MRTLEDLSEFCKASVFEVENVKQLTNDNIMELMGWIKSVGYAMQ